MTNDIRGFLRPSTLTEYKSWLNSGKNRESSAECLHRELREELAEVGLDPCLDSIKIQFRKIRSVQEGPEFIASEGYHQFRIFDVYDLNDNSVEAEGLLLALTNCSETSSNLLWVTSSQIKKGRAEGNQIIAAHSAYFFGEERFREGDPGFVTR